MFSKLDCTTPGSNKAEGSRFTSSYNNSVTDAFAVGTTCRFKYMHTPESTAPITKTGAANRTRLIPPTRNAVISCPDDKRPNTSNTADKKPHGNVNISEDGSTFSTNLTTTLNGARCSTSNGLTCLNKFPNTSTRLRTATAYTVPSRICLPIYRSEIRIASPHSAAHSPSCPDTSFTDSRTPPDPRVTPPPLYPRNLTR